MHIVSIINQKGGCGKTTTAINLAGILARRGFRTLLVDMDPQSHCAAGLAIPEQRIDQDIGDAMLAEPESINPQRLLWRVSRNLDLAPSRMKLAGLEAPRGGLAERSDKEQRLAGVLRVLSPNYDLCLVDCSPSIGLLTYNALAAATDILIPVETSFFALQGASKQINTIKTMTRRLGSSPRTWVVATIHDDSSVLSRDLLAELRRRFDSRVAPVVIRRDVTLKEAASFGQPIVEYNEQSVGASDYGALADWLAGAIGLAPGSTPAVQSDSPEDGAGLTPTLVEAPAPATPVTTPAASDFLNARVEEMAQLARAMLLKKSATSMEETSAQLASSLASASRSGEASPLVAAETSVSVAATLETEIPTPRIPAPGVNPLVLIEDKPAPVPTSAAGRELLGVRQTAMGTLFVQPLSIGRRVSIAGDFNNWSATTHPMRRNESHGIWELCIQLPPGRRQYRLVVDGRWIIDPHNPSTEPNPYHETNSVVVVGEPAVAGN